MGKYHMRKQERQITDENELKELLIQGKYAIISMCRDNEPYIVTLSYGYDKAKDVLYFHTGTKGLKMDFIGHNPNVCATIIKDCGYIKNECGHSYSSIVLFGKMAPVEDLQEKKQGMECIINQLEENADAIKERALKNDDVYKNIAILRLDIAEKTGKKGR